MSEQAYILGHIYPIDPVQLIDAQQWVPVDQDNFVPLHVFDGKKLPPFVMPTLRELGGGAVALSLDGPFGFRYGPFLGEEWRTPQIEQVVLEPDSVPGRWCATFYAEQRLDSEALDHFDYGFQFYAIRAAKKLS